MKGIFALLLLFVLHPVSAWACSACYGQSDSPLAAGMNWGILSLLGMIGSVLAGVAGFFVYLARRSARLAAGSAPAPRSLSDTGRCRGNDLLSPTLASSGGEGAAPHVWAERLLKRALRSPSPPREERGGERRPFLHALKATQTPGQSNSALRGAPETGSAELTEQPQPQSV